jgi:hypothetical protein
VFDVCKAQEAPDARGARAARGARRKCFELIIQKKRCHLFGGDYGKDIGSFVSAVNTAVAALAPPRGDGVLDRTHKGTGVFSVAIPEITIKDETNEFDAKEFKEE